MISKTQDAVGAGASGQVGHVPIKIIKKRQVFILIIDFLVGAVGVGFHGLVADPVIAGKLAVGTNGEVAGNTFEVIFAGGFW